MRAVDVVLATGGVGQCFAVTTNPTLSTGDGVALALKAGVACADLEFVQFHPTALHHPSMPRPAALGGAARRGRGAPRRRRRRVHGRACIRWPTSRRATSSRARSTRRMAAHRRRAPLARRDDDRRLRAALPDDLGRVPNRRSRSRPRDWLPVAPAAHYLSGGVVTDLDGATTLPHLWACGETACSGVHGANRLASNSLLDGLVFGRRVVRRDRRGQGRPRIDRRDGRCARRWRRPTPTLSTDPVVLRKEQRDRARCAARRGAADDVRRLRRRARRRRACSWPPTRWPTSRCSADDLPAREIATLRGDQPAAGLARDRRGRAGPRGVAGRAHPPRHARTSTTRGSAGSWSRGDRAPVFVDAAGPGPREQAMSDFDPPRVGRRRGRRGRAGRRHRDPRRPHLDRVHPRRPGRRRRVFVAREDGVLAGTALVDEIYRQVDPDVEVRWHAARRRLGRGRVRDRRGRRPAALGPHRRARRAQLPVPLLGRRDA